MSHRLAQRDTIERVLRERVNHLEGDVNCLTAIPCCSPSRSRSRGSIEEGRGGEIEGHDERDRHGV